MADKVKVPPGQARKLLLRGVIAIMACIIVALLIRLRFAEPNPNLTFAYIICAGVSVWGLVDLIRSLAMFLGKKDTGEGTSN